MLDMLSMGSFPDIVRSYGPLSGEKTTVNKTPGVNI